MSAKAEVLEFVAGQGAVDSWTVAVVLGYATLLRLHRHGHLHRRREEGRSYVYSVSPKGHQWLEWWWVQR